MTAALTHNEIERYAFITGDADLQAVAADATDLGEEIAQLEKDQQAKVEEAFDMGESSGMEFDAQAEIAELEATNTHLLASLAAERTNLYILAHDLDTGVLNTVKARREQAHRLRKRAAALPKN